MEKQQPQTNSIGNEIKMEKQQPQKNSIGNEIKMENQQPQKNSIGNELYSGAADFGRFYAWISAIIGTLISIVMIAIGVYIIRRRSYLLSVDGKVTKASYACATTTSSNRNRTTTSSTTCKFDVTYEVYGQSYTKTFSSVTMYSIEDKVTIWYDQNHPDRSEYNPPPKFIGWGLIGVAILIIVGSWVWVWATRRYKFAAALSATSAAVGVLKN